MNKYIKILLLLCSCLIFVSCSNQNQEDLNIFLAASLSSQVEKLADDYSKNINIDSSGSYDLSNKIILGAAPDLALLANYNLKNSFFKNFKFYDNYFDNELILIHKKNDEIDLNNICINNLELGIADPTRAPLGKMSNEILNENRCNKNYNLKVTSNASALINMINLNYVDNAIIYKNDFSKINNDLNFSMSNYNFDKKMTYAFFINNNLEIERKMEVIKFINYLKVQKNILSTDKSSK